MTTSNRRILFIDRDGTLIVEPADEQIDSGAEGVDDRVGGRLG